MLADVQKAINFGAKIMGFWKKEYKMGKGEVLQLGNVKVEVGRFNVRRFNVAATWLQDDNG